MAGAPAVPPSTRPTGRPTVPDHPTNALQNVVWIFDPAERKVLYCSDAYEALWGRPLSELLRSPASWLDSVLAEDRARVEAGFAASHDTGLLDIEFRILAADRQVRWIRVRACPAPWSPDQLQVLGISDDITDRKLTEMQLHERAEHLNLALQAGRLSGWRLDLATGMATSTDLPGEMPIEAIWTFAVPPDEIAMHRRNVARIAEANTDFEFEHRQRRPDDSVRQCVSRGRTVRDETGKAVAIVGATLDITSLKEQEAQLAAALKEKELLVREVHHRVKNSLQIVSTFLLLQRMNVEEGPVRALFTAAADRVHAVGRLHDLLCGNGAGSRIDLADYLTVLIGDFQTASLEPGSTVTTRLQGGVQIDADQGSALGIALNELLTNALKYGRGADGHCHLTISLRRRGDAAALTLTDRGPGLTREGGRPGGIGLVIVEALVQHLRGRLTTGNTRRGARFCIAFPADAKPAAAGL